MGFPPARPAGMASTKFILLTGATGYIGGRLVTRLLDAGHRVRCLARDPARLAGRAWLEFQVEPRPDGGSLLSQTAFFAPRGLAGLLYWYTLYPIHALIFSGLVKRLTRNAAGWLVILMMTAGFA